MKAKRNQLSLITLLLTGLLLGSCGTTELSQGEQACGKVVLLEKEMQKVREDSTRLSDDINMFRTSKHLSSGDRATLGASIAKQLRNPKFTKMQEMERNLIEAQKQCDAHQEELAEKMSQGT